MKIELRNRGFSIIEILVVISIIGIIAAIAIPYLSKFTDVADREKTRRNAQNLALVASAAAATGLDFTQSGNNSVDQVISNVITGAVVANGSFEGEIFKAPNMALEEAAPASAYLKVEGRALQYDPSGSQTPITSLPASNM